MKNSSRLWILTTAVLTISVAVLTLSAPFQIPFLPKSIDKFFHVVAFGALVLPTAILWPRLLKPVAFGAVIYGVAIEVAQPYIGRPFELGDILANVIGVALASLVGTIILRLRLNRQ